MKLDRKKKLTKLAFIFVAPMVFVLGARVSQAQEAVVISPEKTDTSLPLLFMAMPATIRRSEGPFREINPIGLPALPGIHGEKNPESDPVLRLSSGSAPAPAPFLNFEGIGNVNNVAPPDTQGDVGKSHYIQWVNLSFEIFDKTTSASILGPVHGSSLWNGFGGICESGNDGDPIVLYDHLADRWFFSQFAIGADGYQCIAVSTTGDPLGSYYRYAYQITPGGLNDYPKFAIWPDGYLYMANEFSPGFSNVLMGSFERGKMLTGDASALLVFFRVPLGPTIHISVEPANLEGTTPPPAGRGGLFVQPVDQAFFGGSTDRYNIWVLDADFVNPSSSTLVLTELSAGVPPFSSMVCPFFIDCISQPGTSQVLDPLAQFTMYRPVYRNFGTHETLLVNHTVDTGFFTAGIRWTEIREPFGAPFVFQTGTHSPDTDHRWMGSLAMDGDGNLLLGYSISSGSTYPSIGYAGRLATDPLGVLGQTENVLMHGTGSQLGTGRWGDYSTMSVDEVGDPTLGIPPDCAFWFTTEYVETTGSFNWQTRIGAFQFPSCGGAVVQPTVLLKINGEHPPSDFVMTPGNVELTLDMNPGTVVDHLAWFYAIVVDQQVLWVTPSGISTTIEPLAVAPPVLLGDMALLDTNFAPGTVVSFVFFLFDGSSVSSQDIITAVVME